MLALGSIQHKLGMQGQLKIACYISYNPTKSIFSLWGENNIIPSCLLLVMSDTEFLLLRENWSKWFFFDEREKIEQMVVYNGENDDQDRLAMHSYSQKQAENKLKGALQGIFTLVAKR